MPEETTTNTSSREGGSDRPERSDRGDRRPSSGSRRPSGRRFMYRRRKVCKFCAEKIDYIDWKDARLLQGYVPERGKILPRRISGTCSLHQRKLRVAIKRARNMALLSFAGE